MPPASVTLSKRARFTLASLRKRDYYDNPNRTIIIAVVVVVVLLKLAIIFALFARHQRRQERKRECNRQIMAQRRQEMRRSAWGGNMGTTREVELRWAHYDASSRAQGLDMQMDRRDVNAEIVAAPPPYDHIGLPAEEQKRGQIQKPEPAKVDERGHV